MADAASRTDLPALTISFRRGDTDDPACTQLADQLYEKFTAPHPSRPWVGAYQDGCSILALPSSFETYWEGAAGYYTRRKVRKALRDYAVERNGMHAAFGLERLYHVAH